MFYEISKFLTAMDFSIRENAWKKYGPKIICLKCLSLQFSKTFATNKEEHREHSFQIKMKVGNMWYTFRQSLEIHYVTYTHVDGSS